MTGLPPESFIDINGNRLRVRAAGDGPLAVFGHGLLGSIEQIDESVPGIDALFRRIQLLAYDARGHGQSTGPDEPAGYTWESLGQDMVALADHAGADTAVFGGASMGAATALWVALERPERVRGLVLVMPPPLGYESVRAEQEQQALKMLDLLSAMVTQFGLEQTIEMAAPVLGGGASPEEAAARKEWLLRQNPLALTCAVRGLLQSPFHDPECYRRISAPTLVIAHEGDGLHPVRSARLLEEMIPGSRLVVAPEAGYWREHPGEFLGAVNDFLDELPS